jgi:hypothetical protein
MSGLLSTAMHFRFVKASLCYNALIFALFLVVYFSMDFSAHFGLASVPWEPQLPPVTASGKVYFAVMTHTAMGSNDITPKTDWARRIVGLHAVLAWMQVLLVFLGR